MGRAATRGRILAEAEELFADRGAVAITMRGLAARVGVTPMALYRHFTNREALLEAIVDQAQGTFLTHLQRAMAEPTAAGRLAAAGREYLAFGLAHPRRYAVLFMDSNGALDPRGGHPTPWRDAATFRFLVDRVRDCAAAGVLAVDDAEAAALTIWAHVHGLVSLYLAGRLGLDEARFRRLYAASLATLVRAFGWPPDAPVFD